MSNTETIFNDFISKKFNKISRNLIYIEDDGAYILFNAYRIIKKNNLFVVNKYMALDEYEFNSLKNATAFVTLDKYNKIIEAQRILELDKILARINNDTSVYRRLKTKGTLESREISRDKFSDCLYKQSRFQYEIDKYINVAKLCQQKGFENELTRTS
jgi:hypothetical protein